MSNGYADNPGVVAPPPLIYGLPLAAGLYMDRRDPFPVMPPEYAWWIGVALIAVGVVLGVSAFVQFLRKHTAVMPYRPTTAIIRSGPFRITRNPVYLALTLGYIGVALMMNSAWPLLLLPLVLLVMHRGVVLREERYLEQKFGDEYNSYKVSVRRWI
ncbi:MAG TPA: isoprenylcysteine carboxylmethyltransferase family protein [Gemmatimonadaceae bacterium]|nr:isoprenylcysteine carboxylmethyltransferase family protein [Gemmatimonadaceae bacterium]